MIATTEGALDDLRWHEMIRDSGWNGRVVTAYRPDAVVDPDFEGFPGNLDQLGEITGCDTGTWHGYLDAHRAAPRLLQDLRRDLDRPRPPDGRDRQSLATPRPSDCSTRCRGGSADERERRLFRGQMLTEMAKMSLDDGLVHADPSRLVAQPFAGDAGRSSAATRASTSRPGPTMSTALKPLLDARRHRAAT